MVSALTCSVAIHRLLFVGEEQFDFFPSPVSLILVILLFAGFLVQACVPKDGVHDLNYIMLLLGDIVVL